MLDDPWTLLVSGFRVIGLRGEDHFVFWVSVPTRSDRYDTWNLRCSSL